MAEQAQGDRGLPMGKHFEKINGAPQYLGTIQSTGTNVISNLSGAIQKGYRLMVQPDAPGYIMPSNHATTPVAPDVTQTSANGVKLAADEKYYIGLTGDSNYGSDDGDDYLQWLSVSGTTNLKVWRMV